MLAVIDIEGARTAGTLLSGLDDWEQQEAMLEKIKVDATGGRSITACANIPRMVCILCRNGIIRMALPDGDWTYQSKRSTFPVEHPQLRLPVKVFT